MGAKHLTYWDYDPEEALACPGCGWSGRGKGHEEHFRDLLDVKCPQCDRMLLIVSYSSPEQTREAAAAGNERAAAALPAAEQVEARWKKAEQVQLDDPGQLPDLGGATVVIEWDFDKRDGEKWTVLRHQGQEIWRELAYWEGYERFADVFEILRKRYGARLAEVRPTEASETYLYGDVLSGPQTIKQLNASLSSEGDAS